MLRKLDNPRATVITNAPQTHVQIEKKRLLLLGINGHLYKGYFSSCFLVGHHLARNQSVVLFGEWRVKKGSKVFGESVTFSSSSYFLVIYEKSSG